ncbi:DMT family transporter [Marinobacterium jannaschii]|uniref:DMT family transporter n=1 Tax=Marinobacterium jannaschii TaxID=64970 RepID=UPI0004879441|nr:DMT family transporter [Marinobacterium jannaschii]
MKHSDPRLSGVGYGLLAALIWSGHTTASSFGLRAGLNPYDLVSLRILVGALLLLPLLWRYAATFRQLGWWRLLVLCCAAGAPFSLINISGLQYAPVAHSGVLSLGLVPLFALILNWLWLRRRPSPRAFAGLAVMLAGLGLFASGAASQPLGEQFWLGELAFCTSALLWATYAVCAARWQVPALPGVAITCIGSLPLLPLLYWISPWPADVAAGQWLFQGFYQGLLVAVVAVFAYGRSVIRLGPEKGALFSALAPGGAALAALLLLAQPVVLLQWAGIGLVSLGMIVALRAPAAPPPQSESVRQA